MPGEHIKFVVSSAVLSEFAVNCLCVGALCVLLNNYGRSNISQNTKNFTLSEVLISHTIGVHPFEYKVGVILILWGFNSVVVVCTWVVKKSFETQS